MNFPYSLDLKLKEKVREDILMEQHSLQQIQRAFRRNPASLKKSTRRQIVIQLQAKNWGFLEKHWSQNRFILNVFLH